METVTLARNAMNTRFELVLHGAHRASLQAVGEAALTEIERLENQLSLFRPSSEIARVNALAALEAVHVSPEVFALLEQAQQLSAATQGAFDITMAPLLRCWGLLGRSDGNIPSADELAPTRKICGMNLVQLNRGERTVRFAREGVMLDLGAIGKGYAVEMAAETLLEAGVASALIHGGTSTVFAIGTPPDSDAWKIAIAIPDNTQPLIPSLSPSDGERVADRPGEGLVPRPPLATIPLRDESLSVSAVAGKCFTADGRTLGHVIDPRTGEPTSRALLSAVVLPSGAETDALSTALLVRGPDGLKALTALRPKMRALVASSTTDGKLLVQTHGIEPFAASPVR